MSSCELLWGWQRWIFYFLHCPGKNNTQFILVNMHMLRHRRQIWRQLSAGIKRHQSHPEERPALTVLSKTKLQDITIGKGLREDRKTESIVRGNGERWLFRPPGLLHWGGGTAEARWKEGSHSPPWWRWKQCRERQCGKSIRIWIMRMNAVPFGCHESQIWAQCWSEAEQWTELRGRLWVSPHRRQEAWHLAKL